INRQYTFVPTDSSQPTRVADSTTEKDSGGNLIFPELDLSGGGTWSQGNATVVQAESATTGGTSGGAVVAATPSPSKTPCVVTPNPEGGLLAQHGILPCGCTTPTPSPTPTASVSPRPTVTIAPGD